MSNFRRIAGHASVSALLLSLGGCAVIESNGHTSTSTVAGKEQTRTTAGLVYSLPKGSLQLAAERKQVAAEDIKKAKGAADEAKAKAEVSAKAWEAAKSELDKLKGQLKVAPETAKKPLEEAVALAQAVASYAGIVKDSEAGIAKAAKQKYDAIAGNLNQWIETASITVLPSGPDPSARYVADLAHNYTRDDNIKLSVTNGLLTSSTATATDQLPNILLSIAQIIGITSATVPPRMLPRFPAPPVQPDVSECKPYKVSLVFDPSDPVETAAQLSKLASKTPGFIVHVGSVSSNALPAPPAEPSKPTVPHCPGGTCSGLYYRVPTTIDTHLESQQLSNCEINSAPVAYSAPVVVPDSRYTYLMPTRAGAFTTSKLTFAFKDGMPVDYSIEQPSEIASIASIPVQIAKALISVPAEMLQLRVNHDTQANALINARTAELQAQLDQLKAKQALDQAQAAAAATPASPTAPVEP